MTQQIDEKTKEQVLKLLSVPGMEIEEIAKLVNIEHETLMAFLSDEYFKHDLNQGRRMCCRY